MILEDLSEVVSLMVGYSVSVINGTRGPLVEIPMPNNDYKAESLARFLETKGFTLNKGVIARFAA